MFTFFSSKIFSVSVGWFACVSQEVYLRCRLVVFKVLFKTNISIKWSLESHFGIRLAYFFFAEYAFLLSKVDKR